MVQVTRLGLYGGPRGALAFVAREAAAIVGGLPAIRRVRRKRYVLPNGMRITATPEEAEAWLRRVSPATDTPRVVEDISLPVAPPASWEQGDKPARLPRAAAGQPLGDLAARENEIRERARQRQRLLDEDETLALLLSTL